MKSAMSLKRTVIFTIVLIANTLSAQAADESTKDTLLHKERQALQQGHYGDVIRDLQPVHARNPDDIPVALLLARAYLYSREDAEAIALLQAILVSDTGNRVAKIELARAYGYQGHYADSERLYQDLLHVDPADEAAAVGLIRDFLYSGQTELASMELAKALKYHPESARLRELQGRLADREANLTSPATGRGPYLADRNFFVTDSAGNRLFDSALYLRMALSRPLAVRAYVGNRSLSSTYGEGSRADLQTATLLLQANLKNHIALAAGGGGVRFNDGASKGLYRIEGEYRAMQHLWLDVAYAVRPVSPTVTAAVLHLAAYGVVGQAAWNSTKYEINSAVARERYSDQNHRREEDFDAIRWFGSPRLSLGAGCQFRHLDFDQVQNHGYFSPKGYFNNSAVLGIRFSTGSGFSANYKFTAGAESISSAPFQPAYEAVLGHKWKTEKWNLYADYLYDHFAQNSGASQAQAVRFGVAYQFGRPEASQAVAPSHTVP